MDKVLWCPRLCLVTEFLQIYDIPSLYVCSSDDKTRKKARMNIEEIMSRMKYTIVLNEDFNLQINDDVLQIKIVEDSQGPLRVYIQNTYTIEKAE